MTRVVALDTSTWWEGLALIEADPTPVVIAESGFEVTDSHSVHVLRRLEQLLAEAAWSRTSVDLYAATHGPGSFTGLRVGLGTVLGLGLASGRPCLGVGTLEAMAEALGPVSGDRIPVLDAGRREAYAARYDGPSSPPVEIDAPWLGSPEQAVQGMAEDAVVFGPGAALFQDRLAAAGWRGTPRTEQLPVAAGAGRLAVYRLARGPVTASEGMSPLYLRPPDAELGHGKR